MPGKSDACQVEVTAISHREARRSDSMIGNAKLGPASSRRASAQVGSENISMGGARRSPRLGNNGNCTGQSRLARTSGGQRAGAALNDITNVTAGRPGQAFGKSTKQPTGQASVPPERAPPASTAATRQLSARGMGESQSNVAPAPTAESNSIEVFAENAQSCHEYAAEIYNHFFRDEANFLARPNYMESQTDINGKMRAILFDWLIEVHMKYRLRPETLFLTINLIDRYLSHARVMRKRLQLVGVVAMSIAAKFEEINPPEVQDFVHITDNAYTKDDVLTMECTMLTALNFQIVVPTAAHFLERLQKVNRCDDMHRQLAEYIIELGLLDMRMLRYPPSHYVSAALMLSNELLTKRPIWPQLMVQSSQYSEQALRSCADEYREMVDAAPRSQLQAVRKKFSQPLRHSVARMTF